MTALSINWASMAWRLLAFAIASFVFAVAWIVVLTLDKRRRWRDGSPVFRDYRPTPSRRRPPHL